VREGESLFVPDATRAPVPAGERRIRQASIEESNVSPIGAMVEMITVQRAYASIQKAVTTLDEIRGTAVSDLGRPV
jgi:flagellar basal-body rod protein FlgG